MKRVLAAEAIGTTLLVATVVGSGIMAQHLAQGNDAIALLGNTMATGAVLYVLITLLGPVSGAQFNPVVTLLLEKRHARLPIILTQLAAALVGTLLAHLMFGLPALGTSGHVRASSGEWLGEMVATFGLLFTIGLAARHRPEATPALVAAWIVAGYWFTSSTSFANPAVTFARTFTDSFSGIRPIDAPAFVAAQLVGGYVGHIAARWLTQEDRA